VRSAALDATKHCTYGDAENLSVAIKQSHLQIARYLASQWRSYWDHRSGAGRGDSHVLFDDEGRVRRGRRARYVGKGACHVQQVYALAPRLNVHAIQRDIVDAGFR